MLELSLVFIAPLVGGLLYGFERVVRARMQNRQGPPLLQPFYDMFKLMDKQAFIIHPYHTILAILHFITLWGVVALIIFGGNLLYAVFLHLLSSLLLVTAGYSVRSIYSHIGANRELLSIVAYEPILILLSVCFYLLYGSFELTNIRETSSAFVDLLPIFIAFLLIVPIKLKKSPFDAAEAHQEIVGGVEIEYSGIFFEFLYMAKWLEYIFIYLLLFLFAGENLLFGFALGVFLFLVLNLVDNATARVRIDHLLKIVIGAGLFLAVINVLGLSYV